MHVLPSASKIKPGLQRHLNEPGLFSQMCSQVCKFSLHSSISEKIGKTIFRELRKQHLSNKSIASPIPVVFNRVYTADLLDEHILRISNKTQSLKLLFWLIM